MRRRSSLLAGLLGALVLCSAALAGSALALPAIDAAAHGEADVTIADTDATVADADVTITDADATATPERTVELESDGGAGGEFTVDAVSAVSPGEPVDLTVETPEVDGGAHDVELRNSDEHVVADERVLGGGTADVTFETSNLEPGTYGVLVWVDGSVAAVHPVVVADADLAVEAPEQPVASDGTATVSVDAAGIDHSEVAAVEVAAWSDGTVIEGSAAGHDDGSYDVSLDLQGAEAGTYDLYVAAVSERDVDGYPAALAIDGSRSLEVSAGSDDGANETDGGDDGDGSDDGDSSEDDGSDGSADDGSDDAGGDGGFVVGDDDSGADGGSDTDDGSESDDADAGSDDGNGTDAESGAENDSDGDAGPDPTDDPGVVQPTDEADDVADEGDDADSQPGFGAVGVLVALLGAAGLARARRDSSDRS